MCKFQDLTGQQFERLTVIKRANNYISPSGKSHSIQWLCKCDCGNKSIVLASNIGITKSCGHCNDIYVGDKIEKLEVLCWTTPYINPNTGIHASQVICLCDCENYTVVRTSHLKSNKTKSCGHLEVHHKKPFHTIIKENRITTIEQANTCEELWDIGNGVTLSRTNHTLFHIIYGYFCSYENYREWIYYEK